jgi:hypothetical protein
LLKLEGTASRRGPLALLANYERSRDWAHAADMAQQAGAIGPGQLQHPLAHYLCEQARARGGAPRMTWPLQHMMVTTVVPPWAHWALSQHRSLPHARWPRPWRKPPSPAGQRNRDAGIAASALRASPSLDVLEASWRWTGTEPHRCAPRTRNGTCGIWSASPPWWPRPSWLAGEKLEHEQFHPQSSVRWTTPSSR